MTTPRTVVACATLAIVVMVLALVAWRGNDELMGNVVSFILGGGFGAVTNYYFGSAHDVEQKDQAIAALNTNKPPS